MSSKKAKIRETSKTIIHSCGGELLNFFVLTSLMRYFLMIALVHFYLRRNFNAGLLLVVEYF